MCGVSLRSAFRHCPFGPEAASQLLGVLRSALGRTQALKAFAEARCWAQRWREQDEVLAAQAEALQRLEAEEAQ